MHDAIIPALQMLMASVDSNSLSKRPKTTPKTKRSSSHSDNNGSLQSLECLVKLLHNSLVVSKRDERLSTKCSLQTFQELLLCLACPSNGENIAGFDSEELRSLKISSQRVVVLWLSAVPWPWQPEELEDSFSLDPFPTYSPAVELGIKCPVLTNGADVFLSSAFLKTEKSLSRPEAPTASQLILSFKELVANSYPVPSSVEVVNDRERTIKHGKFVYTFKWDKRTFISFYKNFETCSKPSDNAPMFAIDCEMVRTINDQMALGRVSVVDQKGRCVYDTHVKPPDLVVDYMTRYSGITAFTLENETTVLRDVQERLLSLLPKDAILVGQSLENDLLALKFAHPYIIDTSSIFIPSNCTRRPSLFLLANNILGKDLKRSKSGHNSITDAQTSLELVQAKISASSNLMLASNEDDSDGFFDALSNLEIPSVMIDSTRFVKKYSHPDTFIHKVDSDQRALWCMEHLSSAQFGWLQLHSYESLFHSLPCSSKTSQEKKLKQIGSAVKFFLSSVTAGTLCAVVFGGSGEETDPQLLRSLVFIKS